MVNWQTGQQHWQPHPQCAAAPAAPADPAIPTAPATPAPPALPTAPAPPALPTAPAVPAAMFYFAKIKAWLPCG